MAKEDEQAPKVYGASVSQGVLLVDCGEGRFVPF